jgi:hypothetical protein
MKFDVLGRDVDVGWRHVAVSFLSLIVYAVIIFIVALPLAFFLYGPLRNASVSAGFGAALVLGVDDYGRIIAPLIGIPIMAFLLLLVAERVFKMTKDSALFRSLAGAYFFIELGIYLIFFVLVTIIFLVNPLELLPGVTLQSQLLGLISNLVLDAVGAVLIYAWLLAIAAPDIKKAKKTFVPAAVFGVALALFWILPILPWNAPDVTSFIQDISIFVVGQHAVGILSSFLSYFVLGFIALYHLKGKKPDVFTCSFAALWVASPLITTLAQFLASEPLNLWAVLTAIVQLALLYGLSCIDLKDIL